MKVYLVQGCVNCPERIFAIFAEEDAALDFRKHYHEEEAEVVERTVYYGQMLAGPDGYLD